ncbi:PoNe immunity protein domain-containing protein, partial [Pseudomonas agarici]
MEIIKNRAWLTVRREPLQKYSDYKLVIESANESIKITTSNLDDSEKVKNSPQAGVMRGARCRAEVGLEKIIYGYSAGHSLLELSSLFPATVTYWLDSMEPRILFESRADNDGHRVPHLDLYDTDYWEALQLVCFAILFDHTDKLAEIMDLLIHENDDQDALLEDLVAPYL